MAVGGRARPDPGAEAPVSAVHHRQRQVGRRGHALSDGHAWFVAGPHGAAAQRHEIALSNAASACLIAGPPWAAWPSCRC